MDTPRFVFFGGEPLGVPALNALERADLLPALIVCNPDRPVGRRQVVTPPPVKVWAKQHNIAVYQPQSFRDEGPRAKLAAEPWDLFVVVAYNFILPDWLLSLPRHGVLNVHPSLLPKLRGASPIRTAIKDDLRDAVGVTVMLMDERMDHGPILTQEPFDLPESEWPIPGPELDARLATAGGTLLAATIPRWLDGDIEPTPQAHDAATYCGKLSKSDSELFLDPLDLPTGERARELWRTVCAFTGIGETFFRYDGKRVKITEATLMDDTFTPLRVIPENQREQSFAQYRATLS